MKWIGMEYGHQSRFSHVISNLDKLVCGVKGVQSQRKIGMEWNGLELNLGNKVAFLILYQT